MRTLALLILGLALLGGSPAQTQGGDLSAMELKDARKLYLGKCAKCHKLHAPANYTPEKWDEWMGKMTKKSKLKPAQAELLTRYLAAGRAGQVQLPK